MFTWGVSSIKTLKDSKQEITSWESAAFWEGLILEQFVEDSVQWEEFCAGAGEQNKKERVVQTKHYERTPAPVSHHPVTLVEKGMWQKSQEQRVELSLGKKGSWQKGAFIFVSVSHSAILKIPNF